jgi:dTDP-4-dehydrorhamnose 3,5-epimerase
MVNLPKEPYLIEGGFAIDDRGEAVFFNDFNFQGIKRFYCIENFSTKIIRAWHGHLKEAKYIFVISGSAILAAVKLDDPKKPSKKNKIYRFVLTSRKPAILYIPPGYANGFRAIEPKTKIVVFSTSPLEESKKDDYRFPYDYWGKEIWEIENR